MSAPTDRDRIPELTSLRFFAAAMIVVHHASYFGVPQPISLDQGVSFFFVLSGFILTYRYPRFGTTADVKRFLALRIARVWPAHVVTTFAVIAVLWQPIDWKLIPNLLMVHAWIPLFPVYFGYNAVSWSISTEFFFYLAFPLLIIGWARTFWWKVAAAAALLLGLMLLGRELDLPGLQSGYVVTMHGLLYVSPLGRLLEFVSGMAVALALRKVVRAPTDGMLAMTIVELAVLLFAAWAVVLTPFRVFQMYLPATADEYFGHTNAWPAMLPLLLVFAMGRGLISRMLRWMPLILLGEASYSLYLVHGLVFHVMVRSIGLQGMTWFAVGAVIAVALSFVMWKLIEMPARNFVRARMRQPPRPIAFDIRFAEVDKMPTVTQ